MEYFIGYFVIGLVVSIILSEIDKLEIVGEDRNVLENADRFIFIVLWPIMILNILITMTKKG
jgi:hypothetical protein